MSIKDYLHKPVDAPIVDDVYDIGRGLTFGARVWMPGINIDGRSYDVGYEEMSEEHLKGIPVRLNGELIGHANTDRLGKATITLLPGKKLPEVNPFPVSVGIVGMASHCESVVLGSIIKSFGECLSETRP